MKTGALAITEHFSELQDPRVERQRLHKLKDIIVIALCGIICGADNWVDIERFGKSKEFWFTELLGLKNGIPSHDTFGKVFAALDAQCFERCFINWMSSVIGALTGKVIAIDGKRLRGSYDTAKGKSAIHMVGAFISDSGLLLGQVKTEDKSNEITAIPELLSQLAISGCIITIDVMGAQREIAKQIIEQEANYVLSLKENQGTLHEDVKLFFESESIQASQEENWSYFETIEKDHGRFEHRKIWATNRIKWLNDTHAWPGLTSIVKVEALRESIIDGKASTETRYFISSLPADAAQLTSVIRAHWGIENQLHWILDVAFREDYSRVRIDHAQENFSILRKIALNLLKQDKTAKGGIKSKRLQAGWDEKFLLRVLSGLGADTN